MRTGKTFWRRNIRAAAFGLLLGCALCWRAGTAEAKLMNLSHFTLGNGLEVAVVENHKAPIVLQMLYYKTGSVNDPKGKGGIAHLLEHMMFRGTKRLPDQAFNRLTEEHGAVSNAYTTYNETGYYEFSDIAKLELMMAMEAERMSGLEMDEAAFAKERDVVLQERRQRFETNPVPLFYETLNKILWQGHPLANPVSGSPEEIKALSVADARDFTAAITARTMRCWCWQAILMPRKQGIWRRSITAALRGRRAAFRSQNLKKGGRPRRKRQ